MLVPAAADWGLSCPFPGDLFAQFERLQGLHLSFNNLTVGGGALCGRFAPQGDIECSGAHPSLLSTQPNLQQCVIQQPVLSLQGNINEQPAT